MIGDARAAGLKAVRAVLHCDCRGIDGWRQPLRMPLRHWRGQWFFFTCRTFLYLVDFRADRVAPNYDSDGRQDMMPGRGVRPGCVTTKKNPPTGVSG
jgi:hypothetical protein